MKVKIILVFIFVLLLLLVLIGGVLWQEIGQKPKGERLKRVQNSPHYVNGGFQNEKKVIQITTDKSYFQMMKDFLFVHYPDVTPKVALPTVKTDLHQLDRKQNVMIWLGHSTVFIQMDGIRYLFDPVLEYGFPSNVMMKPYLGTAIYTPEDIPDIDYLVITHDHWDHLDRRTVIALRSRVAHVVCGLGVGQHFEYWGYDADKIHDLDWNDKWVVDDRTTLHCLESRHVSGRMGSGNPTLFASYMIEGTQNVYITGDTGFGDHFEKIAKLFPKIDLAIMENGQYGVDWHQMHLMPHELQEAVKILQPHAFMTYHHAKFSLSNHPWYAPLENITKAAEANHWHLLTPMIGFPVSLEAPSAEERWWKSMM